MGWGGTNSKFILGVDVGETEEPNSELYRDIDYIYYIVYIHIT
jgi:hypothetical protein